jgi:transposase-like protein
MAEGQMMTAADVVAKAMAGEHGDLLRDAVALVVRELMEAEVAQLTGAGRGERSTGTRDAPQRVPASQLGDAGRRDRAVDPQDAVGAGVLPELSGAAAAL